MLEPARKCGPEEQISDQDCDRQKRDLEEYAEKAGFEEVEAFRETLSGIQKAKGMGSF